MHQSLGKMLTKEENGEVVGISVSIICMAEKIHLPTSFEPSSITMSISPLWMEKLTQLGQELS
jgi:hypothetical protein